MTLRVCGMVIGVVLLAGAAPGWSQQQYLYAPQPLAAQEKVQKKDGVLVQEVPVKKGDSLYRISRRFSGHGSYFPQILLFNEIKDPNRIYTGDVLRIPVSRSNLTAKAATLPPQGRKQVDQAAGPGPESTPGELKKGPALKVKKLVQRHKAAVPAVIQHTKSAQQPPAAVAAKPEQRLFERAIKAYRQEDYRTAVELFDRFLADYPSSTLAADASLYKAECYLKQSNL